MDGPPSQQTEKRFPVATEDLERSAFENAPVPRSESTAKLKVGAIGLFGVLFMALANAAPITAMTGNVPYQVAYGDGIYAPAAFIVAVVVLTLFTIGYISMARFITTAGAFYGFISQGLGQLWGMAAGLMATMAYVVFEGSLVGIFAYFADAAFSSWFGWHINWLIYAFVCIIVVGILGYFDINIAAVVLGVFLICEVVLLGALAFSVLFKGGGPNGLMWSSINPLNAFKALPVGGGYGIKAGNPPALLAAGSVGIGLFFAFWSWVGYETTAVYGEESRNPRKIIPRATIIAVLLIGVIYTFVSWMVIAGNGAEQSINLAANNSLQMFIGLAEQNLGGHWISYVFQFLLMTGSFACALAFHNAASRYIYAIGREVPGLKSTLGATHKKHGSPHIASLVQTIITALLTVGFYVLTVGGNQVLQGGYIYEYGLLAILGTMAILIVMAFCSLAVIWYFHVKKVNHGNPITTLVCPALGGLGMVYVVVLLVKNLSFAGGGASVSPFFHAIPYMVAATFLVGLLGALYLRAKRPEVYSAIGQTVLEEAHERVEV